MLIFAAKITKKLFIYRVQSINYSRNIIGNSAYLEEVLLSLLLQVWLSLLVLLSLSSVSLW